MINPNRRNSIIRIIMELKTLMRDRITTGRRERKPKKPVNRDDHCDTLKARELKINMRDRITTTTIYKS
jgi:hypothetical protein